MPNNPGDSEPLLPLEDNAQSRILRFLWRSKGEWSGREIARKVGLSAPACHAALKKLDSRGLVQMRRVSNMHLYVINPDSYLLKSALVPLFEAQEEMPRRIDALVKKVLAKSPGVVSIGIFGSMARGEARLGSDLDVFVIVHGSRDSRSLEGPMEELRLQLFRQFHLPLSPYVQTIAELRHKSGLPLIQSILSEGRTIHGKNPKELLI